MNFKEYIIEAFDPKLTIKNVMAELFGDESFVVNGGGGWEVTYDIRRDQLITPYELRQRVKDPKERAEIMDGAKKSLKEKKLVAKAVLDRYKKDITKTFADHKREFDRDGEPLTHIEQMRLLRGEKIGRAGL